MSVKVTVGQQTFIKKIVLGTPVTTARETLSIDEFTDFDVATKSDGQILVFDSSEGVFKNFTFDVGQGLAKQYSPGDDKLVVAIDSDKTPIVTGILSKGNLTPTLDSTFDLGESDKKWRELYLSGGTIHLGGLNLKDSGGDFSIKDSLGDAVNIDLAGSVQQIRGFFSSGGDLSYDSATGKFQFDVEQVYTKTNFDSDLGAALSGGVGIAYDSATDTINIDSAELEANFKQDIRGYFSSSNSLNYNSTTGDFRLPQPLDSAANPTFTNITATGDVIFDSSGAILFDKSDKALEFGDNYKAVFGDNDDLQIYHHNNGTGIIQNAGAGQLQLRANTIRLLNQATDENFAFFNDDGSVDLYHNNIKRFETTDSGIAVTDHISLADNGEARFGTGDDLQIYHTGTTGNIKNTTGSLILQAPTVRIQDAGSSQTAISASNGIATLLFENSAKLATAADGVAVTGQLTADSATFTNLTRAATVDSAIYGSASQIPVLTINTSGFIDSIGTVAVAGVSSTSFDSSTGIFTINTADGNSFPTHIQDSADLVRISRKSLSATDAGGDGSFSYNNSTGVFTYTGPSASEVRSHFSAGGDLSYDSATGRFEFDVEQVYTKANFDSDFNVALDEAGTDGAGLAYNSTTNTLSIDSAELTSLYRQTIRGYISGGSGIGDSVNGNGIIKIDSAELYSLYKHDDFSDFVADEHIAHSGVNITAGFGLNGGGDITSSKTINIDSAELTNYFRQTIRTYLNVVDDGGDGSFAYDSALGKFTYTGPSSTEVRAHLSASNSLSYNSSTGDFRLPQPLDSAANPTFNQLRGPASFVIDPAAIGDNTGTVRILGNLQVEGTQTIINSTTVSLNDKNIVIADSAADSSALDGGGITWGGASIVDTPTFNYSHADARLVSNREINAPLFSGSGASLTNLPAASLTGTIDSARIPTLLIADIGNITSIDHDALTNFVANEHIDHTSVSITAGTGLKGGGTIASTRDLAIDSSELTSYYRPLIRGYVSGGTGITYNSSTGEITTTDNEIVHDNLSGFVADEHVAHSGVSITAGFGLKGGGNIASTRDLAIDSAELLTYYEPIIRHDNLSGFVANEHIDHTSVSVIAGNGLAGGGDISSSRTISIDSSQIKGLFSAGGDLSYNSGTGEFSFDVEQVYTKNNFDSDYFFAKDSANTAVERNQHDATTKNFAVTVASKSGTHVYQGQGSGNAYYVDGTESPIINLKLGRTYRFTLSSSDMSSHPFRFYYDAARTTQFTTGVTTAATYTEIAITESTPPVLHYQCSSHGYMGHAVEIGTRNLTGFTTTNLTEGTNLYYTDTRFDNRLATKTTDNLSEGSNLYYTNARVQTFVDSAYVQARQSPATDSAATQAMIDSNLNNDITFGGDVNFDSAEAIIFDKSDKALKVKSDSYALKLVDNAEIRLGDQNDTEIRHTGSRLEIYNATGDVVIRANEDDKDVVLQADNGSGGVSQYFRADGSTGEAKAYHYGSEKFKTSAYGATVTGTLNADSATLTNLTISGGTSSLRFTGTSVQDVLQLNNNSIVGVNKLTFNDPGANEGIAFSGGNTAIFESPNHLSNAAGNLQVTHGGTRRFTVSDSGADVVGQLQADSATIRGGVLDIKNTGTQSEVRLFCEDANQHYVAVRAPAHNTFSGNVVLTLPSADGTIISTSNSNAPTTTTSAADADFVLVDDGGTMKKITPANLGISSGITIQDSGSSLSTLATTLNFVGAGVVASGSGSTKTITISGGGSGSGAVAGGDTMVQFNDGGAFGGDADFTFAKSTNTLTIGGPLIATSKSFDIKHPTKKGHRLRYGSLEGPENGVYVRGRANSTKINLPDYWTGLVDEESITVNLTPIGKHQKLYVEDISNNTITIGNDNLIKKEINCFYTVYAERKDINKITVEYKR